MEGEVKISLTDYEKLREVEKKFQAKSDTIDGEREQLTSKLKFQRITMTVWTHFLLSKLAPEASLSELVEEFNQKGTSASLSLHEQEDKIFIIVKQRITDYV